ncbi:hypothetical protein N7457_000356 [Penicillium paradoxum]|uniref:uncharacterized protein n=1 Tax=Penicillium paradoxum TaxID=176176 RepID=UPI002548F207|nr:uncharacterized protein N7457_000356 [Penicillium paradoxum]KAJ5793757.1 hypothetical protein N7457_000356 [Penicillium paradoxum]
MAKPFKKVHAAIVGKFENGVGEKIPQWIRANGGQYSRDVNARVTHLIATKDAFKQRVAPVETAKKMSAIKIVSYDWLEDSLQSSNRKPKPEGPYLLKNLMLLEKKESKKKEKTNTKAPNGVKKNSKANAPKRRIADPFLAPKGKRKPVRQVYQDVKTNVIYSVTLFRPSKPPVTSREKYQLTVFESIAEPHTYSTYAKFSRVGTSNIDLLVGPKGKLESAVNRFKQFFKEQTGKEWDERANGKMPPPKTDADGKSLPFHEGWFYLEEKTTLLGAYLRDSQVTEPQKSTSQKEDATQEHDTEVELAKDHVDDQGGTEAESEDDKKEEEDDVHIH